MNKNMIFIEGVAMTRFDKQPNTLAPELAQGAILNAVKDANLTLNDIEAIYCANVFGGMILGQLIVRDLQLQGIPIYNIENACASGATAVHLAKHALLAEQYKTILVIGIEQLTQLGGGTIPLQLNDHKTRIYSNSGLVLPSIYAMRATRYLYERDEDPSLLAQVAVKNRFNGSLNPYAQQRTPTTIEEVLSSRMIADPLTLMQCCPSQVDGAAALILSTEHNNGRKPVKLLASIVQSGMQEKHFDDILDAEITARAARQAYEQAGIGPNDIDVIELHDAFTIAELIYYEALGIAKPGEGPELLRSGKTGLSGKIPVNPSGGLLAKGHPLGATGVAQMVELTWQLEGRAMERQVNKPKIALAQCTGGGIAGVDHAASSVHILGI